MATADDDTIVFLVSAEFLVTAGDDDGIILLVSAGVLVAAADDDCCCWLLLAGGSREVLRWVGMGCGVLIFGSADPMMTSSIS